MFECVRNLHDICKWNVHVRIYINRHTFIKPMAKDTCIYFELSITLIRLYVCMIFSNDQYICIYVIHFMHTHLSMLMPVMNFVILWFAGYMLMEHTQNVIGEQRFVICMSMPTSLFALISLGKTKFVSGMLENEFTWNPPDYNYYFIPIPNRIIAVFGYYIDFQFWYV